MSTPFQTEIFENPALVLENFKSTAKKPIRSCVSGTFAASLREPIHRWFRYSAGFSSVWASHVISERRPNLVLDPFVGSGTVCVVADKLGIPSIGVEAHPFVARLAKAKTSWAANVSQFKHACNELVALAKLSKGSKADVAELLSKCYTPLALNELLSIRNAYHQLKPSLPAGIESLLFLAISSILRPVSHVGTAQWQYILPTRTKSKPASAFEAFNAQIQAMCADMATMQTSEQKSGAQILGSDARTLEGIGDRTVDLVITSPPYANNYDYADATRLEMTFWGEVSSWGGLHDAARKFLVRSSSQHVSKDRLILKTLLADEVLNPIRGEIEAVCKALEAVKQTKGGKKSYDLMLAAYYADMARTFIALRRVLKTGGEMCWVIGDSAPYGVHAPADKWIGELALAAGFRSWSFEKLRDRNIKWKNRKHRVPLHEGRLWVKG